MKTIDTATTRTALPFARLIPALRAMFIEGCEVPLRHTHVITSADGVAAGTTLIMPAWQPGAFLGIKTVNIFPGNADRALPGLFSTYVLYDARTGEPLAQIDGNEITARRTAAASALAASYIAPPAARSLLVVGAGRVGSLLAQAYHAVFPITQVTVWSRNREAAQALALQLRTEGFDARADTDLAAAAAQADIVSCATLATSPLIEGQWLKSTSHLDLIGGFAPQMREADDACFQDARLFIDTREALEKSGDLLGPMSRGVFAAPDVAGTLADLARGTVQGRPPGVGRTVFKSVGTALEDLAAAMLVYRAVG